MSKVITLSPKKYFDNNNNIILCINIWDLRFTGISSWSVWCKVSMVNSFYIEIDMVGTSPLFGTT